MPTQLGNCSPVPNGDEGILILLRDGGSLLALSASSWPDHAQGLHVVSAGMVSYVVVELVGCDGVGRQGQRTFGRKGYTLTCLQVPYKALLWLLCEGTQIDCN